MTLPFIKRQRSVDDVLGSCPKRLFRGRSFDHSEGLYNKKSNFVGLHDYGESEQHSRSPSFLDDSSSSSDSSFVATPLHNIKIDDDHDNNKNKQRRKVAFANVSIHEHALVSASQLTLSQKSLVPLLLDWNKVQTSTRCTVDDYEYQHRRTPRVQQQQPRRLSLKERRARLGLENSQSISLSDIMAATAISTGETSFSSLLDYADMNGDDDHDDDAFLQFGAADAFDTVASPSVQREPKVTAAERRARFAAMGHGDGGHLGA